MQDQQKRGTLAGILCYTIWGLYPFYWRLLDNCASQEIIAHRIIWCFATTVLVCALTRTDFVALLRDARARRFLLPAAAIITVNWSVYIWAVMVGHVVEAAIGYYINPLVSILFGVVFFKEKLTPLQLVAVVLCAAGVVYCTVDYGQFPWISLVLAFSFGAYGAIKKRAGYPALQALATENTFMVVPAIVFGVALAVTTGENHFFADVTTFDGWKTTALLLIAGPVTAVPLILHQPHVGADQRRILPGRDLHFPTRRATGLHLDRHRPGQHRESAKEIVRIKPNNQFETTCRLKMPILEVLA